MAKVHNGYFSTDKKGIDTNFVAETKSTLDADKRRKEENQKIKCGERHFDVFDEVNFKEVTKVSELM